ncbi:ribosomal protein S18-alanine N-acetyltransferase [Schaalia sp. 19OD2882]|nr:ribosomal protein S18-alanine N-acetyltransferase [Schaalia sp. 19OD2882]
MLPLGPEDAQEVHALESVVFAEDPWTFPMVAEELSSPRRHWVGVREEGVLVAWAGIALGVDADVMSVGVAPAHRGRGIGRALVEDLLRAAREAGAERVFLEVRRSNEGAQHLYRAVGFKEIGRVARYFRNPVEDAVTMCARLA